MQLITDRRALHQIPELELELPKTMEYIHARLTDLNCRVFSPAKSSLCAFFDFGADHAIAFRADCDALPILEKNDHAYASAHPGCMHACGHDGHTAILLELARRLSDKKALSHNVLLIFQPGEESPGGAAPICKTGILSEYKVTSIFGLHLWPGLTKGVLFSRENELMSRCSEVNIDIYGKSAHIAKAAEGCDATEAAATILLRAYEMERSYGDDVYRLLKFGKLCSGTARNALSAHCHMEGSLRSFRPEVFADMQQKLQGICADAESQFGCKVDIHFAEGYPAVMNDAALLQKVRQVLPVENIPAPSMTGEDFGWYQQFIPGVFFFLGLGDVPALHTDTFDFDDSVLMQGADFFEKLAEVLS